MATEFNRDVEFTTRFKRDFKREKKGRHRGTIETDLMSAVALLADDLALPVHFVDHALTGNWKDHRDCHLKPDLVLIYRKIDPRHTKPSGEAQWPLLQLVRLGSHSQLGI
jgi:mRNA interferase YafQ